ncbi:hypothetical protein NECAME_04102 [Necator americanus]|uniref:Animal hem peroxidase n=1 Tax=Necator americanus TaxID=51031 RepID=W2SZT5_NECAM|nr:hypothetical protein NECAME_04102 [Necator americanus]ETN74237.1 hypothetical protein NECAME_04102 [Necator americanus]
MPIFTAPPMRLFSLGKCTQVVPVEVETRQVFSVAQMRARQQQMGCAEVQIPASCSVNECFHKSFRSIDGTCNNLANPIVGAAFTPFTRLLPSAYDDGINALIGATTRARPNPREVSMFLLSTRRAIGSKSNSMLMQFGQVVNGRTFPPNNRRDSMTVGDDRATIFIGLAAMHTTFLRLHNG